MPTERTPLPPATPEEETSHELVPHPLSPPPGTFELPHPARYFLDLFAGRNAPIFHACQSINVDLLYPADLELGWDILNDDNFERILHAAWNGFLGGIWSAPPCREYSRLKLRPGGPPPLRTPDEPYGRSDLTSSQQLQLQEQETIHDRGRQILNAAFCKGATVGWETPPSAMTLLLTENTEMLRDWNATCTHVAACHWGMHYPKAWLMCSNDSTIASLGSWCTCPQRHPSFAGKRSSTGAFISADTAEYPTALALAIAQVMTQKCTFQNKVIHWSQPLTRPSPTPTKKFLNDGGGIPSTGDWSVNHHADIFASLRERIWQYGCETKLHTRVEQHLREQRPDPPLTEMELNPLKQIMNHWASEQGWNLDWSIATGQKFRLKILETMAEYTRDPDLALHPHLQAGVPTGVLEDIPPSYIFPPKTSQSSVAHHLQSFSENWKGAMDDPDLTWKLIEEEMQQGWVEEIQGGMEAAHQRWEHIAVGKLNVVHSDNRKPRLVLDSSCCNVNQRCTLPETMVLPTVDDVRASFDPFDVGGHVTGLSLDIQAAHKQIRLAPQDQGLVMFTFNDRVFHYKVSHFGGRFSAFWWARFGAYLIRLLHRWLAAPHKAFLYVDDILVLIPSSRTLETVWLTVTFLMLLGTPLSWKKAQLGPQISWIGWSFDFNYMTVQLMDEKVTKLKHTIRSILQNTQVTIKQMEQLLGMLIWFTAIAKHLRPHLSPLYKCLYSPPATLFSIPAASWSAFVGCLDKNAVLIRNHPHFFLPLGGKVIEMGHQPISNKECLPLAPKTSKLQWVRIACPQQTSLSLSREASSKLAWLLSLIDRENHIFPIPRPAPVILRAAADAFAEGNRFGIGGWIITSSQVCWFSEQFTMPQLQTFLPQLTKDPQRYIASFEILAQLALLQMASEHLSCNQLELCIPASSDNTAAESSINRSLSNKQPAAYFLQLISQLAWQKNIWLQITHIPGVQNQWADDLSRDHVKQWLHYPRIRTPLKKLLTGGRVIVLEPPGDHPPWLMKLTQPKWRSGKKQPRLVACIVSFRQKTEHALSVVFFDWCAPQDIHTCSFSTAFFHRLLHGLWGPTHMEMGWRSNRVGPASIKVCSHRPKLCSD